MNMQDAFFEQLTRDLKKQGCGLPKLIVDAQALEQNIQYAKIQLSNASHLQPRLVVKSLACFALLKNISHSLQTQRFMV